MTAEITIGGKSIGTYFAIETITEEVAEECADNCETVIERYILLLEPVDNFHKCRFTTTPASCHE